MNREIIKEVNGIQVLEFLQWMRANQYPVLVNYLTIILTNDGDHMGEMRHFVGSRDPIRVVWHHLSFENLYSDPYPVHFLVRERDYTMARLRL